MAKFREITIKNFKFYHLLFQILFKYHSRKKEVHEVVGWLCALQTGLQKRHYWAERSD